MATCLSNPVKNAIAGCRSIAKIPAAIRTRVNCMSTPPARPATVATQRYFCCFFFAVELCRVLNSRDIPSIQTCSLRNAGSPCRSALQECDLPEYCTGKSEYCPGDLYKLDGTSCGQDKVMSRFFVTFISFGQLYLCVTLLAIPIGVLFRRILSESFGPMSATLGTLRQRF